ncbi:MAG: rhomboid family intramembrane serine protease [Candidatus Hadarchaeota archaeon]
MLPVKVDRPPRSTPVITYTLAIINLSVFAIMLVTGTFESAFQNFGLKPSAVLSGGGIPTLFTSMFLHGGFLHLMFNMWFLLIFGGSVEDVLGWKKFLLFFIGAGVAAGLIHITFNPASDIPAVGASGAISSVMGAFIILYPFVRIHAVGEWSIIKIPAVVYLFFWFILQFLGVAVGWIVAESEGIAYATHVLSLMGGMGVAIFVSIRMRRSTDCRWFAGDGTCRADGRWCTGKSCENYSPKPPKKAGEFE